MNKQTFYRKDTLDNIRVWSISIYRREIGDVSDIVIESGVHNGAMIETKTPISKGLGGKSIYEQAVADAQTEINKKKKIGYVGSISEALLRKASDTHTIPKPMKGEKYHPEGKNGARTLDRLKIRNKMVGVQRKLDGWRFRIIVDETGCFYYTSSGDLHPGFDHITESLLDSYKKLDIRKSLVLDGEIYNHELGYYKTASACGTKVHITPEKLKLQKQMQFHLFDVCDDVPYPIRLERIKPFYSDVVLPVETTFMEATDDGLKSLFEQYLSEGYEGLMIRTLDKPYEYKRCNQLTKWKPLIDGEYKVVDFLKSITGETLGALICETKSGLRFNSDLKGEIGTDAYKQHIWDNQSKFRNQYVTIDFLEYTPDGKPRNGKAKSFRTAPSKD